MKRTKDLEKYVEGQITNCDLHQEYIVEIVKRLQAYDRIKKKVTEEWIEEKAEKWFDHPYDCELEDMKDFIRSLVEEIQGRLR